MNNTLLLLLGGVFVASSAYAILLQKDRRHVLLDRIGFHRRRTSGAKTPPRSLSPGKKELESVAPDYSTIFPPSRRSALRELQSQADTVPNLTEETCLPFTTSYLEAERPLFTPCGFSTEEIKALGDFPDYATLSGVPLPKPYPQFDIKKALPRPYRPFRWNYHQTMCTCPSSCPRVIPQLTSNKP